MNMSRVVAIIVLIFLFISMRMAYAEDTVMNSTAKNPVVEINAWLGDENAEQPQVFAVTEQVVLTIDVSTPSWFVGSTTIGKIDIPNLVAKQRMAFATNYSAEKNGRPWVHQRWEITLYPQSSGTFTIPALPVTVNVADSNAKKVQGTIWTNKLSFLAQLPSGELTAKDKWFSASNAKISQQWKVTRDDLKVGDAITRTVNISASDSLSILLPQVLSSAPTQEYQSYADPVVLDDSSPRGEYRSTRQDQVVYVVQEGGSIRFPELRVKWWNTKEGKVESVVLEGKTFTVSHTPKSFIKAYWPILAAIFSVLLIIVFTIFVIKRYLKTHEAPLWLQYQCSIWKKTFSQSRLILYIKLKRTKRSNVFSDSEELSDIGESILQDGGSIRWKSYWQRIKPASSRIDKNNIRTPLKLKQVIEKIK